MIGTYYPMKSAHQIMIETCYPMTNRGNDWDVCYPMRKYASNMTGTCYPMKGHEHAWDVLPSGKIRDKV